MNELIDRNRLRLEIANRTIQRIFPISDAEKAEVAKQTELIEIIMAQPTVEAEPVRHGRWIKHNDRTPRDYYAFCDCSECGKGRWEYEDVFYFSYCPYCGAKMDKGNCDES